MRADLKVFFQKIGGKNIAVMYDVNTQPFAEKMIAEMKE